MMFRASGGLGNWELPRFFAASFLIRSSQKRQGPQESYP
jgi:hypothetical protein